MLAVGVRRCGGSKDFHLRRLGICHLHLLHVHLLLPLSALFGGDQSAKENEENGQAEDGPPKHDPAVLTAVVRVRVVAITAVHVQVGVAIVEVSDIGALDVFTHFK